MNVIDEEGRLEETIKEISVKHGINVSKDDPILILQTMNDRLLNDSQKSQQEIINQFKSELEEITHAWEVAAKRRSESLLNASLGAIKENLTKGIDQGVESASAALNATLGDTEIRLTEMIKKERITAMVNLTASLIVMLSVVVLVFVS